MRLLPNFNKSILCIRNIFIFLYFLLFSSLNVYGINEFKKIYLTSQSGLSNSSINCILQDSCGLLWLGTWDGLNMYDSREMKVFKPGSSNISNNIIRSIIEEKKGVIWIATDLGINRYDIYNDEFTNFFVNFSSRYIFKENSFFVVKDEEGHIYSYVNGYGLFSYNSDTNEFIPVLLRNIVSVRSIFFDKSNQLWLLSEKNELYCITLDNGKEKKNYKINLKVDAVFYEYSKDLVWIQTTDKKLYKVYPSDYNCSEMVLRMSEKILSLSFNNDCCYIGTLSGLFMWNFSDKIAQLLLKDISVQSLYNGIQDILWVGTDARGVVGLSKLHNKFFNSTQVSSLNFGNSPVRAFHHLKDSTLIIGTKGEGLFLVNSKSKSCIRNITTKENLLHNSVYAFCEDGDYVWICTEGIGLNYYSVKEKMIKRLKNSPDELRGEYSIYKQNDSILWVGTNGWGLFRLIIENKNDQFYVKSHTQYKYDANCDSCLNNNSVFSILSDGDRGLWIGTRGGGLNYLNFSTEKFHSYRNLSDNKMSISNNDVLCLYGDNIDKSVWIGTSYGLNHLVDREKGIFERYTEKDGMPNNTIHGILKDSSGFLWTSTNNGLARIDIVKRKIVTYNQTDGLIDNEYSDGAFFQSPYSGEFFFGGINGYTQFNPVNIKSYNFMPRLYLSDFSINNIKMSLDKRLMIDGVLSLNYYENLLTFCFVPVDFIQGSKCEVSYKIDGYNKEWVYLGGSGTVVLNNLPPGKYSLQVKYSNANKEWAEDIYTLPVRVYPPWWFSWYAYCIYIILIVSIIVYLYINAIHKMKMKRELEIEMLENQKAEEVHQTKLRFFTNIAHEFCNSLTLIYGPSERLINLCADNPLLKRYLSIIRSNAERMQDMIQQLMEFRKVETGYLELHIQKTDIKDLALSIVNNFIDIAEEKSIEFKVHISPNIKVWNTDSSAFEKILFNLLSNAFKYTPENGNVWVNVDMKDGSMWLSVKNTGRGIREDEKNMVFDRFKVLDNLESQILNGVETRTGIGLALCKSLTEMLKGSIRIDSKENEYTEFILLFPFLQEDDLNTHKNILNFNNVKPIKKDNVEYKNETLIDEKIENNLNSILIVDDDDDLRMLLIDILKDDYNVLLASNGLEALDVLSKYTPDVIISDVIMPDMGGFELVENIKKDEITAHIPIIMLSSDSSVDNKIESAKIGVDVYMNKPFHEKLLLATVKQLLSSRKKLKDYFNSPTSSVINVEGKTIRKEDKDFINNLTQKIIANMSNEGFSVGELAVEMNISKIQLYRKLKELKDETPTEFIRNIRLKQAEILLKTTNETIQEIMYKCGFNNKAYFYRIFLKEYNKTPKKFRNSIKE